MIDNYYQNPTFPTANENKINEEKADSNFEKINLSLIDIINKYKDNSIKIYATYSDNTTWKNKIFEGKIEYVNNNYIILKDLANIVYVLKTESIDYLEILPK